MNMKKIFLLLTSILIFAVLLISKFIGTTVIAQSGIEIDNLTYKSDKGQISSMTISHQTSGSERLMLVGVSLDISNVSSSRAVYSIRYQNISLTKVGAVVNSDVRSEIWQLVDPPMGTHDVVITLNGSLCPNCGFVAGAVTFNGVDQTTPLGEYASNTGSSSPASVSVSSVEGELVFDTVSAESVSSMTVGSGQTEHWKISAGLSGAVVYSGASTEAGAGSVNMSWNLQTNGIWAIGAVPIKPAAAFVPTLTPTPTLAPDLDPVNSIYSYSGLGHYTLDPAFDGDRTPEKDVTIFLISGSLEITQNFSLADERDTIVFIVNGNIYIDGNVSRIPGLYISSQTFSVAAADQAIIIDGMVYAKFVNLQRKYYSYTNPAYTLIYQPKYMIDLLPYLGRSQVNWQEVSL